MNGKIILAIDGGCEEHMCTGWDDANQMVWQERMANNHTGCDQVLEKVREWQGEGKEVWVAAEGIGGYLSPWDVRLMEAGCKYVNIPPLQVKGFREGMFFQTDKDDEKDSSLLAKILRWLMENDQARPCEKRDEYFQTLRETARAFTNITESKVNLQHELVSMVRTYWPELVIGKHYFSRTDGVGFLKLLAKYPTPQAVSRAGKARVTRLLSRAMRSDQTELAERLVKDARSLRKVVEVSATRAGLVQRLAESVMQSAAVLKPLEKELEEQLQQHPFGTWLLEQEGIGPRTAGCFFGEAGDLDRFDGEAKLARYAGTGATKSQSGKSEGRHRDGHRYNHRLKRALLLMAESRARHHQTSSEYLRARQHSKEDYWKVIKKLARHLVRFLWRNWVKLVQTQFDGGQESPQKA